MVVVKKTAAVAATATTVLLSASSALAATTPAASPAPENLRLQVTAEGNVNYFLRDQTTAAQVLFTDTQNATSSKPSRFVAALPAGNSGLVSYFLPLNDTSNNAFTVTLVNGTLQSATGEDKKVGVKGSMAFSKNAQMGVTVMGATRASRDYVEGRGVMHEIFNYTLNAQYNETYFQLNRKWINSSKTMDFTFVAGDNMRFQVTPSTTNAPPNIQFLLKGDGPGYAQWSVLCNETGFAGLPASDLFLPENAASSYPTSGTGSDPAALKNALKGLNDGTNEIAKQVSFLAYADKFTAGGWRFLTYFGRDTLFSLRLLMPILKTEAIEAALGAVIARTNPQDGTLCHEETIGDYASFININNNQSWKGDTPEFDYKMVDTDMLLLPVLSHYFLELPQGKNRASALLSKTSDFANGTTYAALLEKNVDRIFNHTAAFAQNPVASNLIAFRPNMPVGNWWDSNQGTGYGPIAFDNNVAYAPSCLRAIQALAEAGIIKSSYAKTASEYATVWESKAEDFFKYTVDASTATKRLDTFVQSANLTSSLLYGDGSLNTTTSSSSTPSAKDVTFYSLSLKESDQIPVLHSDLGFALLMRTNISASLLRGVVTALQPYPRGLLTNIGMLIANPAYSPNTSHTDLFSRGAYHGTVVWSFQQAIMAAGLQRQLNFCGGDAATPQVDFNRPPTSTSKPEWCSDTQLVSDLKRSQTQLWQAIKGVPRETLFSELWSYVYDADKGRFGTIGLGALSPEGTEADAIQLWSFTFLALADPTMPIGGVSDGAVRSAASGVVGAVVVGVVGAVVAFL
ncbi:hypothetical protein HK104_004971 [Borealophlyctis nickersoniae]|nr:hypothetical protein HK104_004971 [Borealophlyctis nickersoniae]